MDTATAPVDIEQAVPAGEIPVAEIPVVEQDLLVEDVSIDGMCGVY